MDVWKLRISEQDFSRLKELVFSDMPNEAAAFALAGVAQTGSLSNVIVRRPIEVPKKHVLVQHRVRLEIAPQAINGLAALCESNGLGAVLCHSHPGDFSYSPSDDFGESRIFEILRRFVPPNGPMASLLFCPNNVTGRVWLAGSLKPVPISEIIVIGRRVTRLNTGYSDHPKDHSVDAMFDRQVRAFGAEGQRIISTTRIGIVGLGGTGSPTAEQLVRLGASDLVLIDPDRLSPSSLTRMYGTFADDLRHRWWRFPKKAAWKVERIAAHLRRINPMANVQAIAENVVLSAVAQRLLDRDVIFLCTDNHWSRALVNQIAYQYFIPTINVGVRIDASEQTITGAAGTIDVLRPDAPCLWCSQFLNAGRITAESTPRSARRSLEREGYVEGIDSVAPSVVSFTTTVSGMAVSLFLQLMTDFMGPSGEVARLNYAILDGTVTRGRATIPNQCDCKKVRGFGDLKPLRTLPSLEHLNE